MVSHVYFHFSYVLSEGYHFIIVTTKGEDVFYMVAVYFTPYFWDKAIYDNVLGCDMRDIFLCDIKYLSWRSD